MIRNERRAAERAVGGISHETIPQAFRRPDPRRGDGRRPRRPGGRDGRIPAPGRPTNSSARSPSCTRGGSSRSTRSPARRSSRSTAARPSCCPILARPSRTSWTPRRRRRPALGLEGRQMGAGRRIPGLDHPARVLGRPAVHPRRLPPAPPPDPGRHDRVAAQGDRRQGQHAFRGEGSPPQAGRGPRDQRPDPDRLRP